MPSPSRPPARRRRTNPATRPRATTRRRDSAAVTGDRPVSSHVSGNPLRLKNHSAEVSQITRAGRGPAAEHRQRPAGQAAQPQAEHLGGVRAVEQAARQRVHQDPRAVPGEAERPEAVDSRRRVSTNATAPLHRCRPDRPRPARRAHTGSRPHIHRAVSTWTQQQRPRRVVSHAFICSTPENPNVESGRPAGSCSPAYAPSATVTPAPGRSTAVSPDVAVSRLTVWLTPAILLPGYGPASRVTRSRNLRRPEYVYVESLAGRSRR